MKKLNLKVKDIKQLKSYWKRLRKLEDKFFESVDILEKKMQKEMRINDLEFFCCYSDYVGIGNYSRTIKLIHSHELEK